MSVGPKNIDVDVGQRIDVRIGPSDVFLAGCGVCIKLLASWAQLSLAGPATVVLQCRCLI